jgi:uncharacterized protein YkwD
MRRPVIIAAIAVSAVAQGVARDEFLDFLVLEHNEVRARHHAPPLVADEKLSRYARAWAIHLAASGKFEHSHGPYGENLYFTASSSPVTAWDAERAAIAGWVDEQALYHYGGNDSTHENGHFTQVVWKSSVRLGCGMARGVKDGLKAVYVVCNYDPPGNVSGDFRRNVTP